ncbi:DUF6207 family protein [Streptomyces ferrugineus]|uniref:DUF6207 family protein n=1 Tax=Streptomyces ferrugineus TaxID=1413221 RepID=UPI001D15C983|nr:DUF6207 family protein [Streptomyces ferrugineus]
MTSTASSSTTTPYRLVVDVAAADEATALAFQQLLAGREKWRKRSADDAGREVGRAKDCGQLREDFTSRDLVLLMANAGVLGATADAHYLPRRARFGLVASGAGMTRCPCPIRGVLSPVLAAPVDR